MGSAHVPWSWAGLALWLAKAVLAASLSAGLLLGPLLADAAWDRGVHVTPAQAATHYALISSGLAHHHAHSHNAAPASAGSEQTVVEDAGSGLSWGTPTLPALVADCPMQPPLMAGCVALPGQSIPESHVTSPSTPPPETAA